MQVDSIIQNFFAVVKNIKWRNCEEHDGLEWYYAEDMHYIIRQQSTNAFFFVKAKSPNSACDIVWKKIYEKQR